MSRAFVKEDAAQEAVVVSARAPLPEGERNLVTPRGLGLLEHEAAELRAEQQRLQGEDGGQNSVQRRLAEIELALEDLDDRLRSAVLVDPAASDRDEVRFGHTVVLRTHAGSGSGQVRRLHLVGVDEADPAEGRVAFVAPIARLLLGKRPGDRVTQPSGQGSRILEIMAIE